jgi:hypothetical protein
MIPMDEEPPEIHREYVQELERKELRPQSRWWRIRTRIMESWSNGEDIKLQVALLEA